MDGAAVAALILWAFVVGCFVGAHYSTFRAERWWQIHGLEDAEDWANRPDDDD